MGIPLDVLQKWSQPGKSENSKTTYQIFQDLLINKLGNNLKIFLQGSYHNSTHVKENSDIDIVVLNNDIIINNTLYGLTGNLPDLRQWKNIIYNRINGAQNIYLTNDHKTIKYKGNNNYVPVDIIPCGYYRGSVVGSPVGIIIYDSFNNCYFVNYPEQHYDNGTLKSNSTDGNFKKTVRMFKNARNKAVDKGYLQNIDKCPSYFLECLVFNVPDDNFTGNEKDVFYNVIKYLYTNINNLNNIKCQNKIQNLFGQTDFGTIRYNKWNISDAIESVNAITKLWDNWS